ncbi:MAG: hypothetical protein ACRDXB_11930, partial [Actinomycetes bacterium]
PGQITGGRGLAQRYDLGQFGVAQRLLKTFLFASELGKVQAPAAEFDRTDKRRLGLFSGQ